jgi:hydroxymethylglutaryl-CoA lyase
MTEIAVFLSASETHNKKNINKTIAEALAAFEEVVPYARSRGVGVRAYVSMVFGCPDEGEIDPERAVALTGQLRDLGVYQISLGDTIGVANPRQVEDVLGRVLAKHPAEAIAVHFHDTQGTALANCVVALMMGITTIDAAAGGLGGCPYAPGASGNLERTSWRCCTRWASRPASIWTSSSRRRAWRRRSSGTSCRRST